MALEPQWLLGMGSDVSASNGLRSAFAHMIKPVLSKKFFSIVVSL